MFPSCLQCVLGNAKRCREMLSLRSGEVLGSYQMFQKTTSQKSHGSGLGIGRSQIKKVPADGTLFCEVIVEKSLTQRVMCGEAPSCTQLCVQGTNMLADPERCYSVTTVHIAIR
ncbi:hypothetical protein AVEN_203190-1 [Araneus ventricosus]|uniref:Uncharacterized protein n=1 Tax=Araneus ventricosus TaxID=182803 RepID=A0A4Y2CGY6_ARAVE|nr:hypothetical protein AVEN_203190-1 [Araneus ventricosus]